MSADKHQLAIASVVLASFFSGATARAEPASDATHAQALFDEGVKLLQKKDFAAACPRLAESFALDPAGGTALDLAFCYESQDRLASAIETYRAALRIAEADHREDREQSTKTKIDELDAKVGHLHLIASPSDWRAQSWQVLLDAKPITPEATDAAFAMDAGAHVVTVSAPDKRTYARSFAIGDGQTTELVIDPLTDVARPVPAASTKKSASEQPPILVLRDDVPRRNWSIAVGSAGFVAIGVGVVSGIVAANLHAESNRLCPTTGCTQDGSDAEKQADRVAWVSNIGFAAGAALVGVGTYLFFTSRHAKRVPALTDAFLGKVVFDLR
jgi:hypothetical protein